MLNDRVLMCNCSCDIVFSLLVHKTLFCEDQAFIIATSGVQKKGGYWYPTGVGQWKQTTSK